MIGQPRVRLRDVTLADADLLDAWEASPEARGEYHDPVIYARLRHDPA